MSRAIAFWSLTAAIAAVSLVASNAETRREEASFNDGSFPVEFGSTLPLESPSIRYGGIHSETLFLLEGSIRTKGALPLPCDILLLRDEVAVLRDGTMVHADVFRPVSAGPCPALLCITPFGKEIGAASRIDFPGEETGATSMLDCLGGPDPAYWVQRGYAVVVADARGTGTSSGDAHWWGRQTSEDGYDLVEWVASQPWCNGAVALVGSMWSATVQWGIAALEPPHLRAIAPWDGPTDPWRDATNIGGIPDIICAKEFQNAISGRSGIAEDLPAMVAGYQFRSDYWIDKAATAWSIRTPAFVASSTTHGRTPSGRFLPSQAQGALRTFEQLHRAPKWLLLHDTPFAHAQHEKLLREELARFLDIFAKGGDETSVPHERVIVAESDSRAPTSEVKASPFAEFESFPAQKGLKLFLNPAQKTLGAMNQMLEAEKPLDADSHGVAFAVVIKDDVEILGAPKLRVWLRSDRDADMNLAFCLRKKGDERNGPCSIGFSRASMRATFPMEHLGGVVDLVAEPATFEPIKSGKPFVVETSLSPIAAHFHAGDELELLIGIVTDGREPPFDGLAPVNAIPGMSFGEKIISCPAVGFTFNPMTENQIPMIEFGGKAGVIQTDSNTSKSAVNHGGNSVIGGGLKESFIVLPTLVSAGNIGEKQ